MKSASHGVDFNLVIRWQVCPQEVTVALSNVMGPTQTADLPRDKSMLANAINYVSFTYSTCFVN